MISHEITSTMIEAQLFGLGDLRLLESPVPPIGDCEVLVKVKACGICPTDLRKFTTPNYYPLEFPFNPGHEWTGDVVAVGAKVTRFRVGDRIAAEGMGGYSEYCKIDQHNLQYCVRLPDTVNYDEGTFTEPLADCIHAVVNRTQIRLGEKVVVLGAGAMGLQLIAVASLSGAEVLVSEPNSARREMALKFGAASVIDPNADDLGETVMSWTNGRRADACIVTIAEPKLMKEAVHLVGARGRVLLFGGGGKDLTTELDPNWIHYNEITLTGSEWIGVGRHADPSLYEKAIRLIETGKVPVRLLITHRAALSEVHDAYERIRGGRELKVILSPEKELTR